MTALRRTSYPTSPYGGADGAVVISGQQVTIFEKNKFRLSLYHEYFFRCGRTKRPAGPSNLLKEQMTMFKTALMEERTGIPWGLIAGCIAFVVLLGAGYFLVT